MKKYSLLSIALLSVVLMSACSNVLDKKVGIDNYKEVARDYREVAYLLDKCDTLSYMKRKFIKDNLHTYVGYALISEQLNETMGEGMGKTEMIGEAPTYRQQIATFAAKYDSKLEEINLAKEHNRMLRNLIVLAEATPHSTNKYRGHIDMNFKVANHYNKEIAYAVLNYKYIRDNNAEQFYNRIRLTSKLTKDFQGEVNFRTVELYNEVAAFLHTKLPEDKEAAKEVLMEGLVIEPEAIVFKDNSLIMLQDTLWNYYEETRKI